MCDSETGAGNEARHVLEIDALIEMDDVVAREPVQAGLIPVIPKQADMLGRNHAIAGTTNNHQALLWQLGLPGEGTLHGHGMTCLLDGDASHAQTQFDQWSGRSPFENHISEAGDRHNRNGEVQALFRCRQQRRGITAQ